MNEIDRDDELLARFVGRGDEAAFAELHRRHSCMVRGVCMRILGEAHADDACQATFLVLARKAKRVKAVHLPGWLHRTAWYIATRHRRDLQRRQAHEEEAARMIDPEPDDTWQHLAPHIDEVIAKLPRKLREAVVLYFFEGKTQREVGDALGCSEEAARKRISRATDQMRRRLASVGVVLTVGALSAALLANAAHTATALATSATSQALADATIRAWQLKTALHVGLAVVAVGAAIVLFPRSAPTPAPKPPPPMQPLPSPSEAAIAQAVEYLIQRQQPDGRFPGRSSLASTALAVRALVAAGHEPGDGTPGGQALVKARDALLAAEDLGHSNRDVAYHRALLTMALTELGEVPEAQVDAIVAAQSASGLWQDSEEQGVATSLVISAWQLQALEMAAAERHAAAIQRARQGLRRLAQPDRFAYSASHGQLSPGASALASIFAQHPLRKTGAPRAFLYHQLFQLLTAWGQQNEQAELVDIQRFLLLRQGADGSFRGDSAFDGGAYATAWAILCLTQDFARDR
jgi:RNA polymerase sigma factor (sigma-70 family)